MEKFQNFTKWFDNLLFDTAIIDYRYPIKGFAVYKEWGAKLVRKILEILEKALENTGHLPTMFPVAISEEDFNKEAQHIEGFSAEVFWITRAGNRELPERMLLRPTSETSMYTMFSKWIRSHADLPLKIHQSGFVYRYETKATRPLLRMREFLWNEAHTVHRDNCESETQIKTAIGIYSSVFKQLGISYYLLKRPDFDKFAGSEYSVAFDSWNPDGRVNQVGTVHNLGENFSKAFNITYEDREGIQRNAVQTCYGLGISRTLAAIVAQHGDDRGLVLPPEIAPIQVVIVPILYKGVESEVLVYAKEISAKIKNEGFRTHIDESGKTPGEKYFHWEMLGVPARVEVGPRELEENQVTLVERTSLTRSTVSCSKIVQVIRRMFKEMIQNLEERSHSTLKEITCDAKNLDSLKSLIRRQKIGRVSWCGEIECAETLKERSGAEIRGYRIDEIEEPEYPCVACGGKAQKVVYVAKAY